MKLDKQQMLSLLTTMVKIRDFEEKSKDLMLAGKLAGFLHSYSGEEAVAAGVCSELTTQDCICSTHRGHGHIIAKGGNINKMMAELFGKATGYSKGKSGSMHIADISLGIIGANGIVAAGLPIANGVAFALRYEKKDGVVVAFFGDGATNRGTFHEALNLASVWNLPVVFVCENNKFGMSVSQDRHMKIKKISDRAAAYGIPGVTVDGNDPVAVKEAAAKAVDRARSGQGPTLIECLTWRHYGHFIGDPGIYKDPEEQKLWLSPERDPIARFKTRLLDEGIATQAEIDAIDTDIAKQIDDAVAFAESSPDPAPSVMFEDVYHD
ncbi:MAG: thiamine pyrophosphate-dependent dehydrogenase E1 component subunit alpha [Propionibacteriaceae bacterium]|nr:thiamine pyrophosphate-dependent dehydrogenase E1 component subunit alpha [Propionibacteriaceae bacterium]